MDLQTDKPNILIICDYYLPGFESGGAMRTLVNMVDRLSDEYCFRVVTRDHDGPLNRTSYDDVRINEWNRVGNADVYYLSRDKIRSKVIRQLIQETKPDAIYLNSFFSTLTIFTLILRRFRRIGLIPIILAPEGELVPGGLKLKPLKKHLYISLAKLLQLLSPVVWKVASESEKIDVETVFGKHNMVFIAPNMPPSVMFDEYDQNAKPSKATGSAKMVFLSRFMRKKNFNWLLDHVRSIEGELSIDVFGPLEDSEYFEEAQRLIRTLPDNVRIEYKGTVPHESVAKTLINYHFFILPTLGENFGHIFVEALASGCPLIISDRSPWRGLEEKGIGWDLSLADIDAWPRILRQCLEMDDQEYRKRSACAREFAVGWLSDPTHEESNRKVLRFAAKSDSTHLKPT